MRHALLRAIASVGHRELARQIQFLKVENEILRARLPARIVTTASERARLIRFGRPVGRAIAELISIVSPRTFARWLGEPRRRGGRPARPVGRPTTAEDVRTVVLRLARETDWGYSRIHGELQRLSITNISRTTVANIIRSTGMPPRGSANGMTWSQFVRAHRDTLWACDFFSRRIWTRRGLIEHFVLFFINVQSRRVVVSPVTANPDGRWVAQQARNFMMDAEEAGLARPALLLRDNDRKFTMHFDALLDSGGVAVQRLPVCSPNLNAFAERWVQSIKQECLDRFVIFGRRHFELLVREYVDYYHRQRPHQSLGNRAPMDGGHCADVRSGPIVRRRRLGGCLSWYERGAA